VFRPLDFNSKKPFVKLYYSCIVGGLLTDRPGCAPKSSLVMERKVHLIGGGRRAPAALPAHGYLPLAAPQCRVFRSVVLAGVRWFCFGPEASGLIGFSQAPVDAGNLG
jgi:hypothetical protein